MQPYCSWGYLGRSFCDSKGLATAAAPVEWRTTCVSDERSSCHRRQHIVAFAPSNAVAPKHAAVTRSQSGTTLSRLALRVKGHNGAIRDIGTDKWYGV